MGIFKRANINGTTPLDIKGINDNFSAIFLKVFGDINMSDIQNDIKSMLYTNWLQPQGEGNIDPTHPLYVRFYVPPTTNKVKSANLNIITSRYRVDSDIASSGGGTAKTVSISSSQTPISDTTDTSTSANQDPYDYPNNVIYSRMAYKLTVGDVVKFPVVSGEVDISDHVHKIDIQDMYHTHKIPHRHNIAHIHDITIDDHEHDLNMGIKEATTDPTHIKISITNSGGETDLGIDLTGNNQTQNNIDISSKVKIGEWNTIKVTATAIGRATVFGIVELLQTY